MIFSEDDFLCFSTEINASGHDWLGRFFFIDKRKLIIKRNYSWREMKVKIS
jgi:hypothetical protein